MNSFFVCSCRILFLDASVRSRKSRVFYAKKARAEPAWSPLRQPSSKRDARDAHNCLCAKRGCSEIDAVIPAELWRLWSNAKGAQTAFPPTQGSSNGSRKRTLVTGRLHRIRTFAKAAGPEELPKVPHDHTRQHDLTVWQQRRGTKRLR
jgi:hypothetical protein